MSTPSSPHRFREYRDSSGCHDRQESPVIRLLRITEQGLVFESWRNFEVGIFIDFGMHVPGRPAEPASAGGLDHKPSFLNLEGFVVDCQACGRDGSYQVTVMFSDLEAADRELLRELELRVHAKPKSPLTTTSMSRREMMLQRLKEVFGNN